MFYLDKSMDKNLMNILLIMMTTIAVQCISVSHNLRNITDDAENNKESFTTSALLKAQESFTLLTATTRSTIQTNTMVSDLQVAAFLFDKRSLQLKINWNTSYVNESTYNVIVTPQKGLDDECPQKICEEYGLILDSPEVYMPRDPMPIIEDKECHIEFGCTYLIQISSSNGKRIKNITYNVPECVEDSCSCRHKEFLPNISISGQIDFTLNRLLIYWNITTLDNLPNDIYLESVVIKLGIQTNPSLPWGGLYKNIDELLYPLIDVNGDVLLQGNSTYKFPIDLKPGSRVLLRGHTIDSRGCNGFDGNLTLSIPTTKHDSRLADEANQRWSMAIVLIMVLIFIVIISIALFFKRIRAKNNIGNWPMVYHSVPNSGVLHISMQENSLYVDKEILEARDRGEADLMEISHHSITIGREIGKGAFGRVFIARADHINGKPGSQIVAVKQLKKRPNPDELEEFLWEIATMKKVGKHPNVVSLLGCCTIKQPLLMIMEFVGCGDLLQYLRHVRARHEARSAVVSGIMKQSLNSTTTTTTTIEQHNSQTNQNNIHGALGKYIDLLHNSSSNSDASYITQPDSIPSGIRPSVSETLYTMLSQNPDLTATSNTSSLEYVLDHKELHNFAIQIAYGMKHLEAKQITHRDLAARNILIDENKTLKISDFGLSRTGIYVNTRNKKVPLRWLSIEAMRDNLYSSKSDIWAFGIVLWEIGTLGGFPYPTVGNHELLLYLSSGQRLQRPENCSQLLYDIMLQCWAEHPEDRFSFSELVNKLTPAQQKIYIDFDELGPNYVFPPTLEQTKNNVNGFATKTK